jgi:hypothetical protein
MSTPLLILLIAAGLVSLLGSLWFLMVAFRAGIVWGLACLFIPFAALVFLAMHWEEAKKPFLMSFLAAIFCGAILGLGSATELRSEASPNTAPAVATSTPSVKPTRIEDATPSPPDRRWSSFKPDTPPPSAAAASTPTGATIADPPSASPSAEPSAEPRNTPPPTLMPPPRPPAPPSHAPIPMKELEKHKGEPLRFRMKDGRAVDGRLQGIQDGVVRLEREMGMGSTSFVLSLADVDQVLERR